MHFLALLFVLAACASSKPVGTLRFHNALPVWHVAEFQLRDQPATREHNVALYRLDGYVVRRATRAMEFAGSQRAEDVNSLDEVPDSSWFENRIGVRELSLDELKRGANVDDPPFAHRPWTITSAKIGGTAVGFIFEDAKRRKFLLKFDEKAFPEVETAAHIIVHRILWAIGYHVPQDYVGQIRRDDLVIGEKAKKKGLDDAAVDRALELVARAPDGTFRVLASRFIPGAPLGPYPREGVRDDDPNDTIPHERRRSLRGQYSIFAWLDHVDIKDDNTIDGFDKGRVTHYLIDFGKALGVMGLTEAMPRHGYAYWYDFSLVDLFGFGMRMHAYEDVKQPALRGIGLFDADHYDPGTWKPSNPYWPLDDAQRVDAFWGAKLLMRFKPHELAAIVDEGQLTDPRSRQYLIETLIRRQRETARYWFDRTAPLDAFTVEQSRDGVRLCFTDLMLSYKLRSTATSYVIDTYDHAGKATGFTKRIDATADGHTCTDVPIVRAADGYTIARLRVTRDARTLPPVVVHLARDVNNDVNLIGLRRR